MIFIFINIICQLILCCAQSNYFVALKLADDYVQTLSVLLLPLLVDMCENFECCHLNLLYLYYNLMTEVKVSAHLSWVLWFCFGLVDL